MRFSWASFYVPASRRLSVIESSGGVPMRVRAIAMLVTILISTKLATSQSTFGNMIGVVKDPGALVVAGAQVTLSGVDDRSTHNAITSGDGTFEFMNLKPGKYEVVVEAPELADSKAPIVELVASELIEVGDHFESDVQPHCLSR